MSTVGLQWIVNAYLLTLAAFVALGGRIGDLIGNARAFRIGALRVRRSLPPPAASRSRRRGSSRRAPCRASAPR